MREKEGEGEEEHMKISITQQCGEAQVLFHFPTK